MPSTERPVWLPRDKSHYDINKTLKRVGKSLWERISGWQHLSPWALILISPSADSVSGPFFTYLPLKRADCSSSKLSLSSFPTHVSQHVCVKEHRKQQFVQLDCRMQTAEWFPGSSSLWEVPRWMHSPTSLCSVAPADSVMGSPLVLGLFLQTDPFGPS